MLLDNALVGIGRSTPDGRLLEANEKLAEIFGYDSVEHYLADYEPIKHYAEKGARERLLALLEREDSVDRYETPVTRRDGSQLWMRVMARLNRQEGYIDFAIEDITREREAEDLQAILRVQLSQSQKMEAVGKLTGGVAHDFNNLLTIIVGNLELLLQKTKDPDVVEMARSAAAAADRAAALTQRLLAFSRKQPLQAHRVNLANTVAEMEDLLVRSLGERIEISLLSADDLSDCIVDPSRLENAILNLAINARDAMAEGGHLTIEVSSQTLGDEHPSGLDAGEYVCLTVSDSGVGMSAEVVRSAFDPFFTTKEMGQGTGLGLSMVYGFAKQSGGHVSIDSQIGEGTTVRLHLPVADVDTEPESPRAPVAEAPRGDGEVILVVEDDAQLPGQWITVTCGAGKARSIFRPRDSAAPGPSLRCTPTAGDSMRLRFLDTLAAAALLLAIVTVPVAAQVISIGAGQTVNGRLDASDSQLTDDSYFDLYEYRGRPGETIVVTLRSSDFDAYLQGGPASGGDVTPEDSDDDSAGGTDARMSATIGPSGVYRIRANSLGAGQRGAYTISLQSEAAAGGGGTNILRAGQTVSGRLDTSDSQLTDDSYFDLYEYRGRPGESIVVTLRSSDFDAYLQGGPASGTGVTAEDSDDDGAGGTDSRMSVTVSSSGVYRIRANSLVAGETGAYTLSVQSQTTASGAGSNVVGAGQTVLGRLDSSDPQLPDDSYYDAYYYDGATGDRLLITLTSSDFDTFLRWGQGEGAAFAATLSDDDGAGNTNSQLEVTLNQSGRYVIQANSYSGDQTGSYTLSIESLGVGTGGYPSVGLGQTVSSRLDNADAVRSDDTFYEIYVYQGRVGEQVLVTMRSGDFDSYLQAGRLVGDRFESETSDDDSGGGTDAQVLATVGANGSLAILANSYTSGGTGQFSLSVESLGGAGTANSGAAALGLPTAGPGTSSSGSLSSSDDMLADSSFYDHIVYAGSPGDRIRITLSSSEFDAYLGWGRIDESGFAGEVYDDDGAGGTNAQLEVTVNGTGLFAMLVNSYTAGQAGSYTLSIERLDASTLPSAPVSGEAGKWLYTYAEPFTPVHRSLSQRVKRYGALEEIAATLHQRYTLPNPVEIRFDTCETVNAFYNPRDTNITFCYELLEFLADVFVPDGQWTEDQRANVFGAVQFIMMHEVGHALVHVLDLPITGREEDVADQLAVYVLVRGGDKGAQAALAGVSALQPSSNDFDDTQLADEHSLGPVRLYNVMCWIYGSDPVKYSGLVTGGSLPEERAVRCPGEWDQMAKAWQRLLAPFRP